LHHVSYNLTASSLKAAKYLISILLSYLNSAFHEA
jgi:hypothetical protein